MPQKTHNEGDRLPREYEKVLPKRMIEMRRMIHARACRATPSRRVILLNLVKRK
jgi:hypothetical protein